MTVADVLAFDGECQRFTLAETSQPGTQPARSSAARERYAQKRLPLH